MLQSNSFSNWIVLCEAFMEYFHIDGMHENIFLPFTRQVFFLSFSPLCYMKYYFLQEYGRLLSIYVKLHYWTLFSGSRNIANNFGPYSQISVRVVSVNQHNFTSPNWYKMESLQFHVTYWLNYCTTVQLCVWSGGAKDGRTLSPNSFISMQFLANDLQNNRLEHPFWSWLLPPSGKSWIRNRYDKELCTHSLRLVHNTVAMISF